MIDDRIKGVISEINHLSESTKKIYSIYLSNFSTWLKGEDSDIMNLTRFDVQSFIDYLVAVKKAKASTINVYMHAIKAFAKKTNQILATENIRHPKRANILMLSPKSLSRIEVNRLLRAVERDGNLRNIAIVYLLLQTGIRVGEFVNLEREDVEMSERKGMLRIRKTKNMHERTVPIPAEARFHLDKYLSTRNDNDKWLFVGERGKLTSRGVQIMLKRYDVHPHLLRHTYIRRLVDSGVDIATVAELAGHLDINVTRRYAKPNMDEIAETIEQHFGKEK